MNIFEKLFVGAIEIFDGAKAVSTRDKAVAMTINPQQPEITQEEFKKTVDDLIRSVCQNNLPYLQLKGITTEKDLQLHLTELSKRAVVMLYDRISFIADNYGKKEQLRNILEAYGDNVLLFNEHIPNFKGYLQDACEYVKRRIQTCGVRNDI